MPRHCVRWRLALLLTCGFVLALAGSLAACGGSSDDDPPPVAPAEQPAAATTTPSAETVPTSAATPELPVAPVEPPAEGETAPIATATPESPAASAEPPVPDPSTPPARVAPEPATGPTELPAEVSTSPAETTSVESVTSPPTPAPHPGVALIEPAPGAFEHRKFASGERIDWTHGIFVFDPVTSATDGYRVPSALQPPLFYGPPRPGLPDGWLYHRVEIDGEWFALLLDRETGQAWRWPAEQLWLVATSREHLLFVFEERPRSGDGPSRERFMIVNRAMQAVGHFSIDGALNLHRHGHPVFSPDGQTIALTAGDTAYRIPVASAQPAVLLGPDPTMRRTRAVVDQREDVPGIRVRAAYEDETGERREEWRYFYFSWEGAPLPGAACQGRISPDGRYVAWLDGGLVEVHHVGVLIHENPWPSVVIADAVTCDPLFRVRSAHTHEFLWGAAWLSNSEGFVVGVHDAGYRVARLHPTPALAWLPRRAGPAYPAGRGGDLRDIDPLDFVLSYPAGPEPAPTSDGRYFGYGPGVYDAVADRWSSPNVDAVVAWWRWGDSHRERWFGLYIDGGGYHRWLLLLPPKIEFPPFSDEIAFRVAGTGSCLRLRAAPGEASETTDCLPDGERLALTEPPNASSQDPEQQWPTQPHPAVAWTQSEGGSQSTWVHVRTADGAEGWVSHDYLEHD